MHVLGEYLACNFEQTHIFFSQQLTAGGAVLYFIRAVYLSTGAVQGPEELPFPHHFLPGQMEPAYLANLLSCWPLSVPSL